MKTKRVSVTAQFRKDCRKKLGNGLNPALLQSAVTYLVKKGQPLPAVCKDVPLPYLDGYRSALIAPGAKLIYLLTDTELRFIRIVLVSQE